jgi:UDP-glucose 4-epimerase
MHRKNILVVGGAGYIGSHTVRELLKADNRIIVLDNLSTGNAGSLENDLLIEGDLGDRPLLDRIFTENAIDGVMHFAAFSQVGESVAKPIVYWRNNLVKTLELVDAMHRHGIRFFIFSSTAAVYGEPVAVPIDESHPCLPTSPYGETKLAVERFLGGCAQAHDLRYVSLRYFNAAGADASGEIGEAHNPETHLIPLVLMNAAGKTDGVTIFGTDYPTPDGTGVRDYIHVTDLAAAHILALRYLDGGGRSTVYNLGNSKGYSVREVIETAARVTGRKVAVHETGRRAGDPAMLLANSGKIRKELGWKPRFENLEAIIETAWKWHRKQK